MKKVVLFLTVLCCLPTLAVAQNIGKCGWGSKLFDGQKGIAPQVLAATTNGTSGNQTFAITSGTSGCTQDGVVASSWKTAAFIDANMNKLARDISRGEGDTLASLGTVMNVEVADRAEFNKTLKENFQGLFPHEGVSTEEVRAQMVVVLSQNASLARYSAQV